jgi:WD40 repeat protein
VLASYERDASTNQRVGFDVDPSGRYLATGSRDRAARVYDLVTGGLVTALPPEADAVNDVAFHPYYGILALATGERHFPTPAQEDEDEEDGDEDGPASPRCVQEGSIIFTDEIGSPPPGLLVSILALTVGTFGYRIRVEAPGCTMNGSVGCRHRVQGSGGRVAGTFAVQLHRPLLHSK